MKCAEKRVFLTEASVRVVLRMEDNLNLMAPYKCDRCGKWHMTKDRKTVRKYYTRRRRTRK